MSKKIEKDPMIEDRISSEIIVDANGREEVRMGWSYYILETMVFPFKAKALIKKRGKAPILEEVTVLDLKKNDDGYPSNFWVEVEFNDLVLNVELHTLEDYDDSADDDTFEVIETWKYWVERGYEL